MRGEDGGAFAEERGGGCGWGVEAFAVGEEKGGKVGWEVGWRGAPVEFEGRYAEVGDAARVHVAGGEEGRRERCHGRLVDVVGMRESW